MSHDDDIQWWERAIGVIETLGALVACAVIATLPVWLALLAGRRFGPIMFLLSAAVVVVAPALLPLRDQPHLDAGQRWGTRMGQLVGAPLRLAARRRAIRRHRALGASTSASSTASPSLPPRR